MTAKINMFNMAGVIPPVAPGEDGTSTTRSPYQLNIIDFIKIFATTLERINILGGFLRYRQDIYAAGVSSGFQWLNGSFVTDIETLENRPPSDIDVVTFFEINDHISPDQMAQISELLNPEQTKVKYFVDAYGMQLGVSLNDNTVQLVAYWYSMWSHRKSDNMWKGFFQVPLSPNNDDLAFQFLQTAGGNL
jgi:hypothetical protein